MAQAAHITQTATNKPSLFDFVAQDLLDSVLCEAANRLAVSLRLSDDRFSFLVKWFDEIYGIGHSLLQLHYLRNYSSTFSEHFYDLRRVPIANPGSQLTGGQIVKSLFFISVVPYIKRKLSRISQHWYFDKLPEAQTKLELYLATILGRIEALSIPLDILNFVQYMKYLAGHTDVVSLFLRAAGVKLVYANDASQEKITLLNMLPLILKRSVEFGAFFFQCYLWYRNEGGRKFYNSGTVPPPPEVCDAEYYGICPLCCRERNSDTVLAVSGYVFCRECITEYLRVAKSCPVTSLPANPNQLISLYR